MKKATATSDLKAIFDPLTVERVAREHNLIQRSDGKVKPFPLLLALVASNSTSTERTIAEVRRQWELLVSDTIAPNSFLTHFHKPEMASWLWELLSLAIGRCNRAMSRQWPPWLRAFRHVLIDDGSRMKLPRRANGEFPATDGDDAGVKVMLRWSLFAQRMTEVQVGAAREHDHAARIITAYRANTLYLRDLGFYDHAEFAAIIAAKASFISRLKNGVKPKVVEVETGLFTDSNTPGKALSRKDVYGVVSDADVLLRNREGEPVAVRVVRVQWERVSKDGSITQEDHWYVCNLPRAQWSPERIAQTYRLRWLIERVFRRCKHMARMDHLRTSNPNAVQALLASSLLTMLCAEIIHARLTQQHGIGALSLDRVTLCFFSALPRWLAQLAAHYGYPPTSPHDLERILVHEARLRHHTQPSLVEQVTGSQSQAA